MSKFWYHLVSNYSIKQL